MIGVNRRDFLSLRTAAPALRWQQRSNSIRQPHVANVVRRAAIRADTPALRLARSGRAAGLSSGEWPRARPRRASGGLRPDRSRIRRRAGSQGAALAGRRLEEATGADRAARQGASSGYSTAKTCILHLFALANGVATCLRRRPGRNGLAAVEIEIDLPRLLVAPNEAGEPRTVGRARGQGGCRLGRARRQWRGTGGRRGGGRAERGRDGHRGAGSRASRAAAPSQHERDRRGVEPGRRRARAGAGRRGAAAAVAEVPLSALMTSNASSGVKRPSSLPTSTMSVARRIRVAPAGRPGSH